MELPLIILGENDAFLHTSYIEDKQQEIKQTTTEKKAVNTSKFDEDIKALKNHVGESAFLSGLCIEMTLSELLKVVPRKRKRSDAYKSLIRHLYDVHKITLKIKTNEKEDIYCR